MNIKSATKQIEGAVRAYLAKDDDGTYLVSPQMQRPVVLMGPPGVGKTAIASQVAERLGINFVSYSITHHTRQSALGLPYIDEATYDGTTYKVSRYTMSEIIASVYDSMERTGVREGILFLDEINCASETLMPAMLQFLQYKTFGQHRLPTGWVIVCAGNPPAYNRAARDFDPAMLDRLKRIDVEPDLGVWMEYAVAHGVHPAITSYLQAKPDRFYQLRAGVSHVRVVTARGWEDLSRMLVAYERVGIKPDLDLVSQYLQDPDTAEDFWLFLELFSRYRSNYDASAILDGRAAPDVVARAANAGADEKIALVGLLSSAALERVGRADVRERVLRGQRDAVSQALDDPSYVQKHLVEARRVAQEAMADGSVSQDRQHEAAASARLWERLACGAAETDATSGDFDAAADAAAGKHNPASGSLDASVGTSAGEPGNSSFVASEPGENFSNVSERSHRAKRLRDAYNSLVRELMASVEKVGDQLDHLLEFVEQAFGDGDQTLMLVSRLAADPAFMRFEAHHGSTRFADLSKKLMLHERGMDLLQEADELEELRAEQGSDGADATEADATETAVTKTTVTGGKDSKAGDSQ